MSVIPRRTLNDNYRACHPIFAFGILLMLCSAVVVPTIPMIGVVGLHILLMVLKAEHEEQFLRKAHAGLYKAYC